ncbi:MAG: cysteine desulfurase family protein [Pseudomonadota bacterium]|nr:cysteine desulfurase family protein [Pseudomonadota bacterium]
MNLPLYLDYNATTPVAPEVVDAIDPSLREHFGNPSSSHVLGRRAHEAVELARAQVAALIGARPGEIVFTGCATEANNLAFLGVARALRGRGRHLITSVVEHAAVAAPMRHLREEGWQVTLLPVDGTRRVAPADLAAALRDDTVLVSVMHANNEVGTLQPIAELAALAKSHGVLFHTDAAQSTGKIVVDVGTLGVDLLTLAGHKFYAPKGVGALYVRHGTPLAPILFGAGHEGGLRPGTENVPHIVGLGAAAELAQRRLSAVTERLRVRRDALHSRLVAAVPGLVLNGHPDERLPNTLHVSFPGVNGRDLLARTPSVAASVGSACHEEAAEGVSGVLGAMGVEAGRALGARCASASASPRRTTRSAWRRMR